MIFLLEKMTILFEKKNKERKVVRDHHKNQEKKRIKINEREEGGR